MQFSLLSLIKLPPKGCFIFLRDVREYVLPPSLNSREPLTKSKQELNSMLSSLHHFVLPVLPTHFVEAVSSCELKSIHLRRGRLNTIEKQTCSLQSAKKETNWRRFMYFVPGLSNTSFAIIFFMEPQWKHRVLFFGSVYS